MPDELRGSFIGLPASGLGDDERQFRNSTAEPALLRCRLGNALFQAIDGHRQMQRSHGFAVLVEIDERIGEGFEHFCERLCCNLHWRRLLLWPGVVHRSDIHAAR